MTDYQLTHLELSTRINLAMKMLNPEREWGEASALAKEYGVSGKFLYKLQDRGKPDTWQRAQYSIRSGFAIRYA